MPTFEEVQEQLKRLDPHSKFWARKEIRELPKILWEGEQIEGAVQGAFNNRIGMLVATDRRVLFVDKGLMSLRVEDFPYDKISSIQYQTGWVFGEITIFASGNRADIKQVVKDQARVFAEKIRNRISGGQSGPVAASSHATQSGDFIEQLERLGKLRDVGVLSEEEFQTQKQLILAKGAQ